MIVQYLQIFLLGKFLAQISHELLLGRQILSLRTKKRKAAETLWIVSVSFFEEEKQKTSRDGALPQMHLMLQQSI